MSSAIRKLVGHKISPPLKLGLDVADKAYPTFKTEAALALKDYDGGYPDDAGNPILGHDIDALAMDLQPIADRAREAGAKGAVEAFNQMQPVSGATHRISRGYHPERTALAKLSTPNQIMSGAVYGEMFDDALKAQAPFDGKPNRLLPLSVTRHFDKPFLSVKDPDVRSQQFDSVGWQSGSEPVPDIAKALHESRHGYLQDNIGKMYRGLEYGGNPTVDLMDEAFGAQRSSLASVLPREMFAAYARKWMEYKKAGNQQAADAIQRALYNLSVGEFPNHLANVKQGYAQETGRILQPEEAQSFLQNLANTHRDTAADLSKNRLQVWDRPIKAEHGPRKGEVIPQYFESQKAAADAYNAADPAFRAVIEEALNKVLSKQDDRFKGVA